MTRFIVPLILVVGLCAVASSVEPPASEPQTVKAHPLVTKLEEAQKQLASVTAENAELKRQNAELSAELQAVFDDATSRAARVEKAASSSELIVLQQTRRLNAELKRVSLELEAARKGN